MGKSRFEGMEIAVREQAKITEGGANDTVEIESLGAELKDIDAETETSIKEIKATPINKELLRKQAQNDIEFKKKENDRNYKTIVSENEARINQAELNSEQTYKQAKLDIQNAKVKLENMKETAKETNEIANLKATQEYNKIISSIDNTELTLSLQVDREKMNGEKRKKEIEIKLRGLKAKNKIAEEQKNGWKQFYNDTVEISKQPQE